MGGILLCNSNPCCYTTVAVFYAIGVVLDCLAALLWFPYGFVAAILPAIGAILFLIAAIAACNASCTWDQNGATTTSQPVANENPIQIHHPTPAVPATQMSPVQPVPSTEIPIAHPVSSTEKSAAQPNYNYSKRPPPEYSNEA